MRTIRVLTGHSPPIGQFAVITAMALLIQGTVWADFHVAGNTSGTFDCSTDIGISPCTPNTLGGLSYTSGGFDVMLANQTVVIGDAYNNLGSFTLDPEFSLAAAQFNLKIMMSLPNDAGTGSTTLPVLLAVTPVWNGSVYGGAAIGGSGLINFTSPSAGSFSLDVLPVIVLPTGTPTYLPVKITVPEPSDLALVGLWMLIMVIGRLRRRGSIGSLQP